MDSVQTGDILSGCGYIIVGGLHIIGGILGLMLLVLIIAIGYLSDLLFGEP